MKRNGILAIALVLFLAINAAAIYAVLSERDTCQFSKNQVNLSSADISASDSSTSDVSLTDVSATDVSATDALTEPVPELVLKQDPNCPLPWKELIVQVNRDYPIRGAVESLHPIEEVSVRIERTDEAGQEPLTYTCNYDPAHNILTCDLTSEENELTGRSMDTMVSLKELKKGTYSFVLSVKNTQEEKTLYTGCFVVDKRDYKKLTPADFRNNYAHALEFFGGDHDKFMFGYKASGDGGLKISTEKEWRKKYLELMTILGEKGYVHVDAVPYVNKAFDYINSTYIRVSGSDRDSGVIPLSNIMEGFAGAYVPRFVRNGGYISHHSFGTALDFNAYTSPNKLSQKNWEIIRVAVSENLVYNGIKTENGVSYYDFTYNGTSEKFVSDVPREIQNYLLYELAFYRAGFGWGYYYSHNCDAMHYTLTELPTSLHETEDTGLRKVFEYIP